MRVLVTGATGFIGWHVAGKLIRQGAHVRALVREGTDSSCVEKLGAEAARGDVRDIGPLRAAMKGCEMVYHLAADYRLWVRNPSSMYEVNVRGTVNVLQAALDMKIEKVIYTSSVGALAASRDGTPSDEDTPVTLDDMCGHYKKSKFLAEREAEKFHIEKGLPVVILNPATPIGAMDRKPTPTGKIIVDFLNGRIPAYLDTGLNFVDVEDVAEAHLLAAERGRPGEKYIIGNRNMALREFFESLSAETGLPAPTVRLPYRPVLIAAYFSEALSNWVTGKPPAIPLAGVRMAGKYMFFNCAKGLRELKTPQTPVQEAIRKAVRWFIENGYVGNGFILKKKTA
ncbi:MAG: NAD-dependent epimerase/dehydratase family protein [Nitrospiraceae bacterium]|nr:NAD-dependent epimerase/dehydratase family protein [Nitrospiraceae bacterium]